MTAGTSPRRGAATLAAAAAGLVLAIVASMLFGGKVTEPTEVVAVLLGGEGAHLRSVLDARVARTVMGALVGSALAVSGLLIQGITRNPLGDPGLLGVTAGASAAVAVAAAITGSGFGVGSVWIALVGATATIALVVVVGGRSASGSVVGLLLVGAVVSAVLTAGIQTVVLTRPDVFDSFRFWVIGSLGGRDLGVAVSVAPALALGLAVAVVLAPSLNALALGDDVATSLGTRVPLVRIAGIVAAGLLAAAATAAAGPISFVGLAVPHIVRSVVGPDHRWQVPVALLGGATLLIAADVVGRVVVRPGEIMVGIVTALIGAPFLLLSVRRGWAAR